MVSPLVGLFLCSNDICRSRRANPAGKALCLTRDGANIPFFRGEIGDFPFPQVHGCNTGERAETIGCSSRNEECRSWVPSSRFPREILCGFPSRSQPFGSPRTLGRLPGPLNRALPVPSSVTFPAWLCERLCPRGAQLSWSLADQNPLFDVSRSPSHELH